MKNHIFPKTLRFLLPPFLGIEGDGGAGGGSGGGQGGAGAGGNALPPATDFRTFLTPEGGFAKHDWAGEEKEAAAKFKSLPDLWKSYRTLERINSSGNKVAIPGDASTEAEWNAFYEKLGRPASEDKYEVAVPDPLKAIVSEDGLKEFRSAAFKAGLNGKQVKAVTDYYFGTVAKANEAAEQQKTQRLQEAESELAKEWGPKDGAKWKENVALAEKGAALAGLTPDVLKATPELSNNPHFIRAMAKVAQTVKEGPTANNRGDGSGGFGGDVQTQIRAIMDDRKHPYWVKDHPDHKKAIEHMAALHNKLAGG